MSKVELSRRGFLKSTLAATGAAMAGTAAHAGDIPEKWQQPKCSGWSWEKPAPKIAPEQIKKTVNTDVVVIGAGLAGFAAALAAAAAAFLAAKKVCPPRVVETEVPFHTGVEDVDAMLADIQ